MNVSCDLVQNGTEWRNPMLGWLYLSQALFYMAINAPCLVVLSRWEYRQFSGYKFMLVMGPVDFYQLYIGGILSGYWSIVGRPWDTYFDWLTFGSELSSVGWVFYTSLNICLAFSRILGLKSDKWMTELFEGRKTWIWIILCLSPSVFVGYFYATGRMSITYHSGRGIADIDACLGAEGLGLTIVGGWLTMVAIVLPTEYAILLVLVRKRFAAAEMGMNEKEKRVVIQSVFISGMTAATSVLYLVVPLLTKAVWASVVVTLIWQTTQGANGLVYLGLNPALRYDVMRLLGLKKAIVAATSSSAPLYSRRHSEV